MNLWISMISGGRLDSEARGRIMKKLLSWLIAAVVPLISAVVLFGFYWLMDLFLGWFYSVAPKVYEIISKISDYLEIGLVGILATAIASWIEEEIDYAADKLHPPLRGGRYLFCAAISLLPIIVMLYCRITRPSALGFFFDDSRRGYCTYLTFYALLVFTVRYILVCIKSRKGFKTVTAFFTPINDGTSLKIVSYIRGVAFNSVQNIVDEDHAKRLFNAGYKAAVKAKKMSSDAPVLCYVGAIDRSSIKFTVFIALHTVEEKTEYMLIRLIDEGKEIQMTLTKKAVFSTAAKFKRI